jgi:hypothetical protein
MSLYFGMNYLGHGRIQHMHTVLSISLLTLIATGCGDSKSNSDWDSGDPGSFPEASPPSSTPADVPSDEVQTAIVFEVPGVPYDITETPDGVIYASIAENGIVEWDPAIAWPEILTERAGAIFGLHWHDGEIWYTTSVHRQEGSLSRLDGSTGEVIATAAGDVVFREPTDLTMAPDGAWVLTDKTVQTLFVVRETETTMADAGVSEPSSITADDEYIYVGGSDGVSRIAWPGGTPELIDNRGVNGLHIFEGQLLGTSVDWGVFRVGEGNRLGFDELRIPGRLGGREKLYVTDWGNAGVWSTL